MKYILKGGFVADGETREVKRADVLISDGLVAAVGSGIAADGAESVDCTGLVVAAGFIDAHVHIESGMVLPEAFGEAILPFGTTAIIADPHEVVNVAGAAGLREFMQECGKSPADVFICLPSGVPATPLDTNGAGKFLAADMREFVGDPAVVGLGEVMCFRDAAEGKPEMADKIALFRGRTIDGHTSGMPESMLPAYAAAGVNNDHECASKEAMYARYACGMNIYVREGSAARNASELLDGIKERGLDLSRFAFCTDDKHLATIAAEGHISYIAALARSKGFGWGEIACMSERLEHVALKLVDGQLLTEKACIAGREENGVNLLATAERHGRNGNLSVCYIAGYGICGGAVATSISHDSHNAVCAGDNGADMALALARLRDIGGGYVIAADGKIAGELPMPAFGLMATGSAAEVAEGIARMERIAHSMGVNPGIDAFTTLSFVALPVIPRLRLLDTGLYDTGEEKFL